MTNRERVITAIQHKQPDIVPYNVFFTKSMLEKMIKHTGNENYLNTTNNHITKVSLRKPQIPVDGLSEHYIDELGVTWNKSIDRDIGVVAEYNLTSAEQIFEYDPTPVDEDFIHVQCKHLIDSKGDNFAILSVGFALFESAWSLCGMSDLLGYMLTDPDAVKSLFDKITKRNLQKLNIALKYDIDGIIFGDDWGQQRGMIMGPPLWRSLIKPHLAELYKTVKDAGKYVLHHSCGDLKEIFDDLEQIGLDVYQTFQPEIYDINEYKTVLKSRISIWGGISTQVDLPFKSPDEIYKITKTTMKVLGENGGFIAAPTHEIPGDVPPENVDAMIRAFTDQ